MTSEKPPTTEPQVPSIFPTTDSSDPAVQSSLLPDSPPRHRPAVTGDGRVKILLAEDDRLTREAIERAVQDWGYAVTSVTDGAKALSALLLPDGPRLALLDRQMPGLSGIDVCRMIRPRDDAPYIYIILTTSADGRRQMIDGLSAGADDFIKKPLDMPELEVRLRAGRRVVLLQDRLLEARAEFERRALEDSLTGVKNHGAVLDSLRRELSRSARSEKPLAVVLADLDHFKSVNDNYGHPAGDEVLREFVRRAELAIRDHDVIGRYGGEEFLLVLPDCTMEEAVNVAERVRLALTAEPVPTTVLAIHASASFGVAGTEQGHTEINGIIAAADAALYLAKAAGRNRTQKAAPPGEGLILQTATITLRSSS